MRVKQIIHDLIPILLVARLPISSGLSLSFHIFVQPTIPLIPSFGLVLYFIYLYSFLLVVILWNEAVCNGSPWPLTSPRSPIMTQSPHTSSSASLPISFPTTSFAQPHLCLNPLNLLKSSCSSTIYSLSIDFTAPTIFNIGCDLRANQNAAQLNDLRHVLSLQI